MPINKNNPDVLFQPAFYSQVATVTDSKLIVLAGQVGWDKDGNIVGDSGDFVAQAEQVFANIKAALATEGADFNNIVKLTIYVVNWDASKRDPLLEVMNRYFDGTTPPANTLIGVQALAREELVIEIDVIAAVDV